MISLKSRPASNTIRKLPQIGMFDGHPLTCYINGMAATWFKDGSGQWWYQDSRQRHRGGERTCLQCGKTFRSLWAERSSNLAPSAREHARIGLTRLADVCEGWRPKGRTSIQMGIGKCL